MIKTCFIIGCCLFYFYSLKVIPADARVVETAHPEALRLDHVFFRGKPRTMEELVQEMKPKKKEFGLFDHSNIQVDKAEAYDIGVATELLCKKVPGHSLPPMWRILELESYG